MDPYLIGVLCTIGLFLLIALNIPIAIAFLAAGGIGIALLADTSIALSAFGRVPYTWITLYVFSCVPLFIFSGLIIAESGLAGDLFDVAYKWIGRLPGGLGMATTGAVGLFGAVSGSSTACVATMSTTCYPEMRRYGYPKEIAAGCIAAGSAIDLMIPPSLGFILYGIITEQSIGKLFIAGIIPGILQILAFCFVIYLLAKYLYKDNNKDAKPISFIEKLIGLIKIWPIFLLFTIIMGGIYTGIVTPIEAGALSVIGSLISVIAAGKFQWKAFYQSAITTLSISAMIGMLIVGAMIFNTMLVMSDLPTNIAGALSHINSPTIGLLIILALYIPLGMVMDAGAMVLLTLPLYLPFLIENDINLIWYGVLTMVMVEISLITPPVGMNVFVAYGVLKDVSMGQIFRGTIPFIGAHLVVLALLIIFPSISLFLPNLM